MDRSRFAHNCLCNRVEHGKHSLVYLKGLTNTYTHIYTHTLCSFNTITGGLWVERSRRGVRQRLLKLSITYTDLLSLCPHTVAHTQAFHGLHTGTHMHTHTHTQSSTNPSSTTLSLTVTLIISQRPSYLLLVTTKPHPTYSIHPSIFI